MHFQAVYDFQRMSQDPNLSMIAIVRLSELKRRSLSYSKFKEALHKECKLHSRSSMMYSPKDGEFSNEIRYPHLVYSRHAYNLEYKGIRFIHDTNKDTIICQKSDVVKIVTLAKTLLLKYGHFHHSDKSPPVSKYQFLYNKLKKLNFVNDSVYDQVLSAIKPYLSIALCPRSCELNMNLSIILSGLPGDGKTFLATSLAREIAAILNIHYCKSDIGMLKAADFVSHMTCVIDDMTLPHFQRSSGNLCSSLLSEMDSPGCGRLFILTTNEKISSNSIDSAFFRPGRVASVVSVDRPDSNTKARFVKSLANYHLPYDSGYTTLSEKFLNNILFLMTEDPELSLAEMFRMKQLCFTDLVCHGETRCPSEYMKESKKIEIPNDTEEEGAFV